MIILSTYTPFNPFTTASTAINIVTTSLTLFPSTPTRFPSSSSPALSASKSIHPNRAFTFSSLNMTEKSTKLTSTPSSLTTFTTTSPSPSSSPLSLSEKGTNHNQGQGFITSAARNVSRDPAKLQKLVNGIQAHDIRQSIPGIGATWFFSPQQFGEYLTLTTTPPSTATTTGGGASGLNRLKEKYLKRRNKENENEKEVMMGSGQKEGRRQLLTFEEWKMEAESGEEEGSVTTLKTNSSTETESPPTGDEGGQKQQKKKNRKKKQGKKSSTEDRTERGKAKTLQKNLEGGGEEEEGLSQAIGGEIEKDLDPSDEEKKDEGRREIGLSTPKATSMGLDTKIPLPSALLPVTSSPMTADEEGRAHIGGKSGQISIPTELSTPAEDELRSASWRVNAAFPSTHYTYVGTNDIGPTPPDSPQTEHDTGDSGVINSQDALHIQGPLTPPPDTTLPAAADPTSSPTPVIHVIPASPTRVNVTLHPLIQSWTLYFSDTSKKTQESHKPSTVPLPVGLTSTSDYSSGLVTLFSASTVEDLLGSWKALRRGIAASKRRSIEPYGENIPRGGAGLGLHCMSDDNNFHLFVEGIKPMWEDPMCAKGGKIMMAGDAAMMDQTFLEVVLLLIGGTIQDICPPPPSSPKSMICGTVISRRKLTRIEIWLGGQDAPHPEWIKGITHFFQTSFPAMKVYHYKAFGK
ncbi:hypothetical protein IAR55_000186 [Kwoniella newhampshirensis]|uniref:Translation initiation factor 4E n=1 Tax=Kwoniella newhampshirensis TaxID=1651941 RepID=A0AAW0Z5X5_9TREE